MHDPDHLTLVKAKIKPIRLVILSDGYKEFDDFYRKAREFIENFLKEDWGKEKIEIKGKPDSNIPDGFILAKDLFAKVEIVFQKSEEEGVGVSKDCSGYKLKDINNYFGSRYCHGRKVEMDGKVPLRILQGDAEKVKRYLYSKKKWDYVLVLCNNGELARSVKNKPDVSVKRDVLRGGYADLGSKIAWVSANSYDWFSLAMHEMGHLIFNLHEEYDIFFGATSLSNFADPDQLPESNIISVTRVEYLLEKLRRYVIIKNNIRFYETYDGKDYIIENMSVTGGDNCPKLPVEDNGDICQNSQVNSYRDSCAEPAGTWCKWRDNIKLFNESITELLKENVLKVNPEQDPAEPLQYVSNEEIKDLGFSNRERQWFQLVDDCNSGTGLFVMCPVEKGPLKDKFQLIKFNVFWKRYDLLNKDLDSDETYLYYRRRKLNEIVKCERTENAGRAGFFEGAGTYPYGMARPAWECRMRTTRNHDNRKLENDYLNYISVHGEEPNPPKLPEPDFSKKYCKVCNAAIVRKLSIYTRSEAAYGSFTLGFLDFPVK